MTPLVESEFQLAPDQFVVVVKNADAFAARYGTGINVVGRFVDTKLSDNGETIALTDAVAGLILEFTYDDRGRWPGRADGKGASLELIDPQTTAAEDYGDDASWRSSVQFGGTPGADPAPPTGIVINEVLTHTDQPLRDAIELYNVTEKPIDVGGWYLSDRWGWDWDSTNGDYKKFRIPDGTEIPAGGYVVFYEGHYVDGVLHFDEDEFGGQSSGQLGTKGFALSGAEGDDVWLVEADAGGTLRRFADHVEFDAAPNGESFGRWPNAGGEIYPMRELTLGRKNGSPRIGPIVISEIMYHPTAGGDEFIELYNPTSTPVAMFDPLHPENTWRFGAGVTYAFPPDVLLGGGGVMLVVPIEADVFRAKYEIPAGVPIFGPYTGALENAGEKLQLLRPDEPAAGSGTGVPPVVPPIVPYVVVDEVDYRQDGRWPGSAADSGDSLHRVGADLGGKASASWDAAAPSPGQVTIETGPKVVGRYLFYNHSAFDADDPNPGVADDGAIATDKTALRPGEAATAANYSGYSLGINGIMVDVANPAGTIGEADFLFRLGNGDDPSAWTEAPMPSRVTVRQGAGTEGSDRVTILWQDRAILNEWLEVTVLAGGNTGLPAAESFYFGNAVAEAGNSPTDAYVNTADLLLARNNPHDFLNLATIELNYDYNRDRRVDTADVLLARNNQTDFLTALKLIDLTGEGPAASMMSLEVLLDGMDWLHQHEPAAAEDQPWQDRGPAAAGVDLLLATF